VTEETFHQLIKKYSGTSKRKALKTVMAYELKKKKKET